MNREKKFPESELVEFSRYKDGVVKWHTDSLRYLYYMMNYATDESILLDRFGSSPAFHSVLSTNGTIAGEMIAYHRNLVQLYGEASLSGVIDSNQEHSLFAERQRMLSSVWSAYRSLFPDQISALDDVQQAYEIWLKSDPDIHSPSLLSITSIKQMEKSVDPRLGNGSGLGHNRPAKFQEIMHEIQPVVDEVVAQSTTCFVMGNVAGGAFDAGVVRAMLHHVYPSKQISLSFARVSPQKMSEHTPHVFASERTHIHAYNPADTTIIMVDHMVNEGNAIYGFLSDASFSHIPMICIVANSHRQVGFQNGIKELYYSEKTSVGVYGRAT